MFRRKRHSKRKNNNLFLIMPALVLILFFYVMNLTSVFRTSMKPDWTGISQPVRDTLKNFLVYEDDYYIYEHSWKSKTEEDRKMSWVLKNASQEELFRLTNHPHGMVKVLAYYKLTYSDYPNKFEMLKKAFHDSTTLVYESSGCTRNIYLLSEFLNEHGLFLEVGTNRPPIGKEHYSNLGLDKHEISELTTLLKSRIENRRKYLVMFYSDISHEKVISYYDR